MITAVHTLIYSDDAPATRAFFKDVLRLPFTTDMGSSDPSADAEGNPEAWLIFRTGPSELGVHPTSSEHQGETFTAPRHHQISFMCDDINATVTELTERGATFAGLPVDMGFGIGVEVEVPGTDGILIYQPAHPTIHSA